MLETQILFGSTKRKSIIVNVFTTFRTTSVNVSNVYSDLSHHFMELVSLPIDFVSNKTTLYKYVRKFVKVQNMTYFNTLFDATN